MIKRILAFLLLIAAPAPAFAGSATIGYTPGSGVNFAVTTDGGGNYNGRTTICDFSACANGLGVDASGRITVLPGNVANTTAWLTTLSQGGSAVSTSNALFVQPGTAATWAAAQSGTWNITNISGTITLPTGAATSANQTNGLQQTQIVDSAGSVIASTSHNLNVQCANCSGSGVSTADEASFTANLSLFAGSGGFFQTTATNNPLTTGQQGMFQVTANRALFTNLRTAAGAEIGIAAAPIRIDPTGTTPQPATQSGTWNVNNISGSVSLPTGAATAANQTNSAQKTQLVDGSGNVITATNVSGYALNVACLSGCIGAGGNVSNATSLATSSTSINSIAYGYAYQGPNWVQMLADGSGFIEVNTAAGGIQGFAPGTIWSGSNGVGIAAGEQHVGEVGANGGILTSSSLGVTAVSHAAGTCLGTLVTFSNAVRNSAAALTPGTSGTLQNIVIGFTSTANPSNLDAIFFTSNPGTNPCNAADAATYTLAAGDVGKALPPVHLSDVTQSATADLMQQSNLAIRYGLASSTTLYGVLVVRGSTFTPATGTTFQIGVFRD